MRHLRPLSLSIGLLLGLILGFSPEHSYTSSLKASAAKVEVSTGTTDPIRSDLGWLEQARESTVLVVTSTGSGSGVCISASGDSAVILTARHVAQPVDPTYGIILWRKDMQIQLTAILMRLSATTDLAWMAVYDPQHLLVPMPVAKRQPAVGELVYASGYPLDIWPGTVTVGRYEGVQELESGEERILHSAAIWFGNSGGPLFNRRGEIIGINVRIFGITGPLSDRGEAVAYWSFE